MNSFQLKLFALALMVLDHLATYVPGMPDWFNLVGRVVAPTFFFFVVEGFFHTKSRKEYTTRLFSWSLIMFAGSFIVQAFYKRDLALHNNIFLSLGMAVILMNGIEWTKKPRNMYLAALAY